MAEWVWQAKAQDGELRTGTMEAASGQQVRERLRQQRLTPTQVKRKGRLGELSFGSPVSEKDLVIFTRQLATMIHAGLPLVQCLEILGGQGENKAFRRILADVKHHVEHGSTFSDSLKRHPKVFDALFVNLVNAGEVGGILDTILQRLALYIEKREKLRRQVRSALTYPTAVFALAILVLFVMMTWVIPSFRDMFTDFGGDKQLPALTALVISISDWFVGHVLWLLLAAVLIGFGLSYSFKHPKTQKMWHQALLRAPVMGPVMTKIVVARFTRTFGTLLSSGVPILEALHIVGRSAGNVIVERAIQHTADKVSEGRPIAEPLAQARVFPPMVVQMIAVGEQTGAVDNMLTKIAEFYEEEVDVAVAGLTSLLEPIMMVGIGGMVGVLLIAMYLPIFDIANQVSGH
ncbi:MAG: type II secretion system F family protein [Polyangiales bacterium]